MPTLDKMRVAVLATDGFEEMELFEPIQALRDKGVQVEILSPKEGEIQGLKHYNKGRTAKVDRKLDSANPADYSAVLLPGGALNADQLRRVSAAQNFVRKIYEAGKPVAAICHAPWLLVSAGLAKGHKLTSFETIQDDIRNAGGNWVDQEVVVDGQFVTSRKPDDIPAFNREFLKLLERGAEARKVA